MTSEVEDHANRPAMLKSDRTPTNPPAAATVTVEVPFSRKKSWIIGLACSRMPMPAVTLQNNTTHSSQNCGVRMALAAETLAVVTIGLALTLDGSNPAGAQPGGGTRTLATPSIITAKYPMPRVTNSIVRAWPLAMDVATDGS